MWWLGRARLRAAAPAGPSEAAPSEPSPPPEVEPLVAELLVRHARRHVGVVAGVFRGGQTWVIGSGTAGPAGPSPPAANTIFEIGSVTKVFTATLLAVMVEEGLLALDDPVQRYLPPAVELPVRERPITLGDLATHMAGLPRLPHGFFLRSVRHRRNPYAWLTVDDLYAGLPSTRLRHERGGRPRYSNLGYGLLGHVLALRAGRCYDQLVQERICRPLELEDTWDVLARGYSERTSFLVHQLTRNVRGMMVAVRLRRAAQGDSRGIAEVHVRAWRAAYKGLVPDEILDGLSVEERERNWRALLSDPAGRSFTFVALGSEDRIEGFCAVATPSRDDDADDRTAEVAATYVDPERWRVGVGSALRDAVLAELRRDGYREATLWVFANNERARSFYRKFGFEPNGREAKHDWSGGQVEVRLRAALTRWARCSRLPRT